MCYDVLLKINAFVFVVFFLFFNNLAVEDCKKLFQVAQKVLKLLQKGYKNYTNGKKMDRI